MVVLQVTLVSPVVHVHHCDVMMMMVMMIPNLVSSAVKGSSCFSIYCLAGTFDPIGSLSSRSDDGDDGSYDDDNDNDGVDDNEVE